MRDLALEAAFNGDPTPFEYGATTAPREDGFGELSCLKVAHSARPKATPSA